MTPDLHHPWLQTWAKKLEACGELDPLTERLLGIIDKSIGENKPRQAGLF